MKYLDYKEKSLWGRYIPYEKIAPLLKKYNNLIEPYVGASHGNIPINTLKIGKGIKKILIWSQMHGNETTATKALFDLLKYYFITKKIPKNISLYIIPMLNPDGANNFTRVNGKGVDLNRNALENTEPEMKYLRYVYDKVKPDFCFNLHDQRSIFGFKKTKTPATLSFLSPAYNTKRENNIVRKKAMDVIAYAANKISHLIPNGIGRFDDSFNINCTGDFFTKQGTPTILFEAGYYSNDYEREKVREFFFYSLLESIIYINNNSITDVKDKKYFDLPLNEKIFCDILVRDSSGKEYYFQYKEILHNKRIFFEIEPLKVNNNDKITLIGHLNLSIKDVLGDIPEGDKDSLESLLLNKIKSKYNFQEKIA